MARLEIEIVAVNAELKRVLRESKVELTNFAKGLNFKPAGIDNINTALAKTKQLLKDISVLSNNARTSLGGTVNTTAIQQERLALAQSRTEAQKYRTELAALRLQTAQNRTATVAATGSYREAQQTLTALGRSIRDAAGGFNSTNPAIRQQITQYRELNARLREFDATMGNHQRNVGNYGAALRGLQGLAASYFGFTALLAAGRQVLRSNAEISDSLADVRRTAGLTAKEATELGKALKTIDTRTSLKDLLGISAIGGQLGIAKSQLVGFTKAVDQLSVSLGSELKGGAEGIAKSLGVLDNVFKVSALNGGNVEKAYNQIGSAILQLGQSGLATGDFLADFGERVGGIAKQAGIALPVVLSFGAVLQENGVSAEVAGTAFKRLISAISSNSGKFFEVAKFADVNLTLKEFTTLINTDTKKALELFFQGMNKGGASTVAFNSILKSLKISGSGASQVVSAIAANLPALEKHILESTDALNKGTLASEQFTVKNNNLAASIDKLGNSLTNLSTNPDSTLANLFKQLVDNTTGGIKAIDIMLGKLKQLKYDQAIKQFDKGKGSSGFLNSSTGNFFIGENDVKAEKARRAAEKQTQTQQAAFKLAAKLNRDALIDIQAESSAKDVLAKTNERLAQEEKELAEIRSRYGTGKTTAANNEIAKQLIAQRELVRLLKIEVGSLTPRSNVDAPAGIGKKDTAKNVRDITDVMKELNDAIKIVDVTLGATFEKKNQDKLKAYQTAINNLIKIGYEPASEAVKALRIEQEKYLQLIQKSVKSPSISNGLLSKVTSRVDERGKNIFNKDGSADLGIKGSPITPDILTQTDLAYAQLLEKQAEFNANFKQLAESGIGEALSGIGSAIGEALATGGDVLGAVGSELLNGFSQFLDDYGDLLIKYGAAAVLKGKLDIAALVPGAGIAAGLAAIAAGVALKAASAAINSKQSGKSDTGGGGRISRFANGGIVSGPTLGLMGEYAGAKSNPEVISPLDKLNSMISRNIRNTLAMGLGSGAGFTGAVKRSATVAGNARLIAGSNEPIVLGLETYIEGSKLRTVIKRADEIAKRGG